MMNIQNNSDIIIQWYLYYTIKQNHQRHNTSFLQSFNMKMPSLGSSTHRTGAVVVDPLLYASAMEYMAALQLDHPLFPKTLQTHCTHLFILLRYKTLCQNLLLIMSALLHILLHFDYYGGHYRMTALVFSCCYAGLMSQFVANSVGVHQKYEEHDSLQAYCILIHNCYTADFLLSCGDVLDKTIRFRPAIFNFFHHTARLLYLLVGQFQSTYLQTCKG